MSPALSPARKLLRTWKNLGAPIHAGTVLALGPGGFDLARAAQDVLEPGALTLVHPDPAPPRARFKTTSDSLTELAATRPGAFDLVLAAGGLGAASIGGVRDDLGHMVALLAPEGVLALVIDTLGAPDAGGGIDTLLFPHLHRQGDLGDEPRTLLPAAAWMLLFKAMGLDVQAAEGLGTQEIAPETFARHAARLEIYDSVELATGRLHVIARQRGDRP
ncbi:hypothetical protein [Brevundimonas sp.]|uniref:hypothetical protein n=1 Tax=Brevundimonas sp. TaxID=1871086 RepID=UPI00391E0390